jgi:hypothetical protein
LRVASRGLKMDSKAKQGHAPAEPTARRPQFTEAQRSNLTRLIEGSRFSVVKSELQGGKVAGKPLG